ncbi:MAG: HPr family phosphocarrier protein [Elusimicrobia bacterium]|nr:HPr family phosphocarrier protein [Elusimicrobiota bacterium]
MLERIFRIPNKMGLHARPAALFVQTAGRFASEVRVVKDNMEVNGKSVMGLMMLAAEHGSDLMVKIWGSDEQKAMAAIERLFEKKFIED